MSTYPTPFNQISRGKLSVLACESGKKLADRICRELTKTYFSSGIHREMRLIECEEIEFANQEIKTVIKETVRGDDLYIVQLMDDPLSNRSVNDNFMALITAVDAAFQSDPDTITVVMPQYPYSRQERRKGREGITAKVVAKTLEAVGVHRVITIDVHAEAIAGFFRRAKFENLHAGRLIIEHLNTKYSLDDFVVCAPDVGSAERARFFAKNFGRNLAIIDKVRNYSVPSTIESMKLVGEVKGQNVFMGDDIIATGGTLINACKLLKDNGAKDIYLSCTFPFFNGSAVEKFEKAFQDGLIKKVIGTDAVYQGPKFCEEHLWYDEISVAKLFAGVIFNINNKVSLSSYLT